MGRGETMYKTIEADIKNGRIASSGPDVLPSDAHVLITVLNENPQVVQERDKIPTLRGVFGKYADDAAREKEASAWSNAMERKHETH